MYKKAKAVSRKREVVKATDAKTGIVMLALGSPQYGRMAANAAASIRFSDWETPIHLVYSGNSISHLTDQHKALFTSMAVCPDEYMTKNGVTNYIKAKACIYELSPFDNTLLIDADLLWFGSHPVKELIRDLSAIDFTMQCRGWYDYETGKQMNEYMHWFDVTEARQAYNLQGRIYQLSSELVWFKKSHENKKLFNLVREVFDNPLINPADTFCGDLPDEMAYNIALAKLGRAPRKEQEVFIFWPHQDKRMPWSDILKHYHALSMGGNNVQKTTLLKYEQMAKAHANALRLPYHFKLYPKKTWDESRAVL